MTRLKGLQQQSLLLISAIPLVPVTAAGLAAGNAGKIVPCGRAALPAVVIVMIVTVMVMMVMMIAAVAVIAVTIIAVAAIAVAGNLRASHRPTPLRAGTVVFAASAPRAAHISAATPKTAAAGQQQQDNQTVHTPYFLSVLLLYPMLQFR